ncbi:MAG: site-specific integrase [Actinomycetia bacterium]|nr:site-specific integrase [Actinomycetes bacterium]
MRLSEVLALSWNEVDFAAGVVHVRHQLARGRRGLPPRRVPPKTAASLRSIPLLPQLAAVLRAHKRGSPFKAGADYVFATSRGTPLLHHNVSKRALRRAATDGGLDRGEQRLRFHDLRHTFASHLIIDIRLDVAQVSRILGHARTSMTLDTYTHLFEQAAHTADVRAQLARSEFANLLTRTPEPQLLAAKHLRRTRAHVQRPRTVDPPVRRRGRACAPTAFAPAAQRRAAATDSASVNRRRFQKRAARPSCVRSQSSSRSRVRPRAAPASAPTCRAGRARSARLRHRLSPSGRQVPVG